MPSHSHCPKSKVSIILRCILFKMKSVFKHPFWAILGYAVVLGAATILIRNLELRWLVMKPSLELYSGALALKNCFSPPTR